MFYFLGGNVLTSQRLVDVVLLAFEACAASQGCCNNITFGNANISREKIGLIAKTVPNPIFVLYR